MLSAVEPPASATDSERVGTSPFTIVPLLEPDVVTIAVLFSSVQSVLDHVKLGQVPDR